MKIKIRKVIEEERTAVDEITKNHINIHIVMRMAM